MSLNNKSRTALFSQHLTTHVSPFCAKINIKIIKMFAFAEEFLSLSLVFFGEIFSIFYWALSLKRVVSFVLSCEFVVCSKNWNWIGGNNDDDGRPSQNKSHVCDESLSMSEWVPSWLTGGLELITTEKNFI